jgi:hypothetical protein
MRYIGNRKKKQGRIRKYLEIKKNVRNKKEGWGGIRRNCEWRTKMCESRRFEEAIHI